MLFIWKWGRLIMSIVQKLKEKVKRARYALIAAIWVLITYYILHTPIHEMLHWIPAYLLGLNPSAITLIPFGGGFLTFDTASWLCLFAILMPFWVLSLLGGYLFMRGISDMQNPKRNLYMGIIKMLLGAEFIGHEWGYQLFIDFSDLNKTGQMFGFDVWAMGLIVALELVGIGIIVERKSRKNEERPSLLRRVVQSVNPLRLSKRLSERRKPKNHS